MPEFEVVSAHLPLSSRLLSQRPSSATAAAAAATGGEAPAAARIAIALVAASSGLTIDALLTLRRSSAPIAAARQLAMYVAHVALGLSQADVARAFGRDRTTVAHACRRIEDLRDGTSFDRRVSQLEACARWAAEH